ncbi:hypothetical protein [Mycolicibacterium llatzerense]|uniref:hypothetical protein n=1 Tax=Mycolicibacterium llatzerense TaxID=280871 RepID=UPI0008DD2FDB|nr:hypothetical protein [Mycolicibacterium llatzerense]
MSNIVATKDQPARRSVVGRIESNYTRFKLTATRPEGTDYPQCQKNPGIFDTVETAVGKHIDRKRDLWSPDIDAAAEIRVFLGWCANCFMKTECLDDMIRADYTGIAGGEFLHKGIIQEPKDKQ